MSTDQILKEKADYKYGFSTAIETDSIPKGLNEETVRAISEKKGEPDFLLKFRLRAFEKWKLMEEPTWANVKFGPKSSFVTVL